MNFKDDMDMAASLLIISYHYYYKDNIDQLREYITFAPILARKIASLDPALVLYGLNPAPEELLLLELLDGDSDYVIQWNKEDGKISYEIGMAQTLDKS